MKFGLLLTPGMHAPDQVAAAEAAGFESAYFVDSPTLFGDVFVSMALAAERTERIRLATGVTNPLTRSLPVLTSSLASLNAVAPGRVIVGFGRGFTANFTMGHRNATMAEMEAFVAGLRALWRGDDVETVLVDGEATFVALLNDGPPWMRTADPLPVQVAASGPRTLRLAGRLGDGVILGGITQPEIVAACLGFLAEGQRERDDGHDVAADVSITPSTFVADRDIAHEELVDLLGPKSLAPAMNFAGMAGRAAGIEPQVAEELAAVKAAYRPDVVEGEDPRKRHLRSFRGYMTELKDWQVPLVTPRVLAATSLAGRPETIVERVAELEAAGITRVILSPLPQHVEETIAAIGEAVIPRVGGAS